jgi:hypothetical protein
MTYTEIKPLQPLSFGNVLIVGVNPRGFDESLRNHPRVIMWDSQNENWTTKDIPHNVRAVFATRWVSHAAYVNIIKEAKKKHITIFNPTGTGIIARQVKELLDLRKAIPMTDTVTDTVTDSPVETVETIETTETKENIVKQKTHGKLKPLIPFIDFAKGNQANAVILMEKAKELGINTTMNSLAILVGKRRKTPMFDRKKAKNAATPKVVDISVQMLDNMIKELRDMRDYLVAVTEENVKLKSKVDRFKKFFDE